LSPIAVKESVTKTHDDVVFARNDIVIAQDEIMVPMNITIVDGYKTLQCNDRLAVGH
jgi:hypothetical protein